MALGIALSGCSSHLNTVGDGPWYLTDQALPIAPYEGVLCVSSHYLTMRDGVKIAIDVHLPEGLGEGERVPTIMRQTRYMRSVEPRWLLKPLLGEPYDHTGLYAKRRAFFATHGYAWVDVDTRGSGASFGTRICPFSPDEILDGGEVVDWIVGQPWSDGHVGATGISYPGSTAEFLLVNKHPAVKAVIPRFALFDAYTDIAFPGGIHAVGHTREWQRINDALDRNAPHEAAGWWVRLVLTGVQPVSEDANRSMRAMAVAGHAQNYNVHEEALALTYRDDVAPSSPFRPGEKSHSRLAGNPADPSGSIGLFSPHNYAVDLEDSGAAIYSYSGWFDGAYPNSAIKRFLTVHTKGSRLILGPWNHGGGWYVDPRQGPRRSRFNHNVEMLRFFNSHLKGIETGIETESPVHYFTMIEGKWKSADTWPPPESRITTHYLAENHGLVLEKPMAAGSADEYLVDYTTGTGDDSRWKQTRTDPAVRYPDRAQEDTKLLTYTSSPLDHDVEVTGHPVVGLFVASTARDGNVFVYLEDIDPLGRVTYVTEGQLRLLHRKLSRTEPPLRQVGPSRTFNRADASPLVPGEVAELMFDLLPTSYLFQKGHAIRVAIAGADSDHFATPSDLPPTLRVQRNSEYASYIALPVVPRQ